VEGPVELTSAARHSTVKRPAASQSRSASTASSWASRLQVTRSASSFVRRCYEPDEGCRSFPSISFVQVVIGRKGDTGKWIAQLTSQLLRIGSSAPWS
jgi:hypothetical protein